MNSFNFDDYSSLEDDVCMHCKTLEEAEVFTKFLADAGKTWRTGESYTNNRFHCYHDNICYYFNEGTYGSLGNALNGNNLVLEFCDFIWDVDIDFCEEEECSESLNAFLGQFQLCKEV